MRQSSNRNELQKRVPEDAGDALRYALDNQLLDFFVQSVEWASGAASLAER